MFPNDTRSPHHHAPLIRVWDGRAAVSRYIWTTPGELTIEHAMNWEELEPDATEAVLDLGGALQGDRTYPCPPDLAARAWWPEEARTA